MPQQYPLGYQPYYDDLTPQYPSGYKPYIPDDEPAYKPKPYPTYTSPGTTISSGEPEKSWLQKWDELWINQPLTRAPTALFDLAANPLMEYGEGPNDSWLRTPSLVAGGFLHNFGEGVSGLTSPLSFATIGAGAVAKGLGKGALALEEAGKVSDALKKISQAKQAMMVERTLSAPFVASGAARVSKGINEGDWTDIGTGAIESILGGAGAAGHAPKLRMEMPSDYRFPHAPSEPLPERYGFRSPSEFPDFSSKVEMSQFEPKLPAMPAAAVSASHPVGFQPLIEEPTISPNMEVHRQGEAITLPTERVTPEIIQNLAEEGYAPTVRGDETVFNVESPRPRSVKPEDRPAEPLKEPYLEGFQFGREGLPVEGGMTPNEIRAREQLRKIGSAQAEPGLRLGLDEQGELFPPETVNQSKGPLKFKGEESRRPFNQEEVDQRATWDRETRNNALYEGRNINDIKTPLTENQRRISASFERMRGEEDRYNRWFSQQEEMLPQGQFFKPPTELEARHNARMQQMKNEHETLVKRLTGGYEKTPPADITPDYNIESRRPLRPTERDEFGNTIFKHDTPIQVRFEQGLENAKAKDWGDTRFLLPDGTRKTHDARTHSEAARRLGVGLGQALRSGVVRVTDDFDGIHVSSPITDAQAQIIADAMYYNRFKRIYVDLYDQNQHLKTRDFNMGASADSIRKWINDKFREPSTEGIESRRPSGKPGEGEPMAIRFDKNLPDADEWNRTRFILPDGTRKAHNKDTHWDAAYSDVGVDLKDAMAEGIVRVSPVFQSAEIHSPISTAQAEVLADLALFNRRQGWQIEVKPLGDPRYAEYKSRYFDKDAKASSIREWVNGHFKIDTVESRRTNPIIEKFQDNFRSVDDVRNSDFILPDGALLRHDQKSHHGAARSLDVTLDDALNAGIIRFNLNAAEVGTQITSKQAQILADAAHLAPKKEIIVDVTSSMNMRSGHKIFEAGTKADTIRNWVNQRYYGDAESRIGRALMNKASDYLEKKTTTLIGQEGKGFNRNSILEDPNGRFKKSELEEIKNIPMTREVHQLIDEVVHKIAPPELHNKIRSTGVSLRNDIYGVVNRLLGSDRGSVLINIASHIEDTKIPIEAARKMMTTIYHEVAHIGDGAPLNKVDTIAAQNDPYLKGIIADYVTATEMKHQPLEHGADWLGRMVDLYERTGPEFAAKYEKQLERIFTGSDKRVGTYGPEAQKLLSIYFRKTRPGGFKSKIVAREGIESPAAPRTGGTVPSGNQAGGAGSTTKPPEGIIKRVQHQLGWGQGSNAKTAEVGKAGSKFIDEALGLSKAATTVGDYSATLKQGLPSITTKEFWKALIPMVRAGWDKSYSDAVMADIRRRPLFRRLKDPRTQKILPSLAENMGFRFIENTKDLTKRSELIASNWIENGRFFGMSADNPLAKGYSTTLGRLTRGSNRAFATLINHIGANRLEFLMDRAVDMSSEALRTGKAPMTGIMGGVRLGDYDIGFKRSYTPEEARNLNPYKNVVLAKDITDFVRTSLGQAPLRTHLLPFRQAEVNLEFATKGLTRVLFAPRLIASRVRMLNPSTYVMASPYVRKQYMKAMLSTALAWGAVTKMAQMSGAAKVNWDPDNSDFGKMRVGDTRFDLGASFLPYLVAAHRLYSGRYISSATGQAHRYGAGFQAETQKSQLERFATNKMEPLTKFAYDLLNASEYQPFHVTDRAAQLFLPLTVQDLIEIWRENPELLPVGIPATIFGMGSQTYQKGETTGKVVPGKYEPLIIQHPALKGLNPFSR